VSGYDLWPLCPSCGDRVRDPRSMHLALRKFTNWSGTWLNSVVCDGKTVTGAHPSAKAGKAPPPPRARLARAS
jgi:hypothetical protein